MPKGNLSTPTSIQGKVHQNLSPLNGQRVQESSCGTVTQRGKVPSFRLFRLGPKKVSVRKWKHLPAKINCDGRSDPTTFQPSISCPATAPPPAHTSSDEGGLFLRCHSQDQEWEKLFIYSYTFQAFFLSLISRRYRPGLTLPLNLKSLG